ncbi:type II toxin-antitoxin system RelE/ParE family toxin [Azotobacter armeniacus]
MLPIIWRSSARADLAEIIRYIANEDPQAARRLKDRLESAVLPLAEHPYLYRSGRVPGTREVVAHPNYVLVYRVTAERIEVVNVLHARQEYP